MSAAAADACRVRVFDQVAAGCNKQAAAAAAERSDATLTVLTRGGELRASESAQSDETIKPDLRAQNTEELPRSRRVNGSTRTISSVRDPRLIRSSVTVAINIQ